MSTWLVELPADERAVALDALGSRCASVPAVAGIVADAFARDRERFWTDGWYRGLATCRDDEVRDLLARAVGTGAAGPGARDDPDRFFDVLDVYARNLGRDAVPRIERLVGELDTVEHDVAAIRAFAAAAGVGETVGVDPVAADLAVAAIGRLAPTLRGDAIDQARDTLLALGAVDEANALARYRWPERRADGGYTYAAVTYELVTCEDGERWGYLHHGALREPGERWPEALQAELVDALRAHWSFEGASACGGTSERVYAMSEEPLTPATTDAWVEAQRSAFARRIQGFEAVREIAHPTVDW